MLSAAGNLAGKLSWWPTQLGDFSSGGRVSNTQRDSLLKLNFDSRLGLNSPFTDRFQKGQTGSIAVIIDAGK